MRERAERGTLKISSDISKLSHQEISQLIHELQTHQFELEVQGKELREAQLALQESRDRYSNLFEFAPMGYFTLNGKSLIIEVNLTGAGLLDLDRKNLINAPFTRFVLKEDQDIYYFHRRRVLETKTRQSCEVRLVKRDNSWFHAQLESVVVEDGEPNSIHWRTVVLDISDRIRAEEALRATQERNRFWASVIELSSQPFAVGEVDGRLRDFNQAFCKLVGYSEYEMSQIDWAKDLTPSEYHESEMRKLSELVQTGEPVRYEKEYIRKDGSRVPVELLVHLSRDATNQSEQYYAFITDLTERKRAEAALKESEARVRMKLDSILLPEGDIGTLGLGDVIDVQAIQALMDDFLNLTNIGMAIVDMEGRVLVATGWQEICTKFHRIHPDACRHCMESDTLLSVGAERGSFKLYRCKNNMWDIATPIVVGGKHLGNLFLGQFFFTDELPDYEVFLSQARQYGFEEEEYLSALEKVPRWSKQTVAAAMTFYAKLADMLSAMSYSNIQLARSLGERERLVDSLRESETRYHSLFENMLEGFAYCRMLFEDGKPQDFIYLEVNHAFEKLTGLKDVVGKKVTELIPGIKESNPELFDIYGRVAFTGKSEKFETYLDSLGIWLSISVYSVERKYFVAVFDNITEHKRAEDALQASEEKYRASFNNAAVGIDLVDHHGKFLEVNNTLANFLGYSQEEFRDLTILDVTHHEDLNRSGEMHKALVRGDTDGYRLEKRYLRKNGTVVWSDTSVSAIKDRDGKYRATIGVIVDITQRRKSEEVRLRLATAVEQADEAIVMTDADGTILYVNPAFERTTGYSRDLVLGNNPRILKSGEHDDKFYKRMWETITSGRVWSGRLINRKKDGTLFEEEATISPIRDGLGRILNYVAVKRDVSNEIALRAQLLQAQKMEAIGTLAGGVAHDFNNLLQVTLGYSELLLQEKKEDDPEYDDLLRIFQASKNGAKLVQQLLTFSRKAESKPIPLDLNRRIVQVEKLLNRIIPKMIGIEMNLSYDLMEISADPTQMEQILMNLAINASDAMRDGGKLTIGTKNVTLDEEDCRIHVACSPGQYVLLTVSDTGHGIEKKNIERIFEPFFTTKELGRGTGLGLATVYGIVRQHDGCIVCDSEVGRGTIFKVYLPAMGASAEEDVEDSEIMPTFGTETLLLVDDEEFVREVGARILNRGGYQVLTAGNGKEALDVTRENKDQISLVVLDLIMPQMGGKACLRELLKIDPKLKVLVASGLSDAASVQESISSGAKGFIRKPFQYRELLRQVRKVLDETSAD
jgi:PAS domain S-box-containing protein